MLIRPKKKFVISIIISLLVCLYLVGGYIYTSSTIVNATPYDDWLALTGMPEGGYPSVNTTTNTTTNTTINNTTVFDTTPVTNSMDNVGKKVDDVSTSVDGLPGKIWNTTLECLFKPVRNFLVSDIEQIVDHTNLTIEWYRQELTSCDLTSSEFIIAKSIFSSLKPLAYSLLSLFFIISFFKKSMYFELMEDKAIYKTLIQFAFGKVMIDQSYDLCALILKATNEIVVKILATVQGTQGDMITFAHNGGNVSVITIISNLLTSIWFLLFIGIAMLISLVMLVIRKIELAVLAAVSPLFFATFGGESSMDVFKSFIKNFVSVAAQTIWMSVAFGFLCHSYLSNIVMGEATMLPGIEFVIGAVALGIFCINCPNSVRSAIGGSNGGSVNLSAILNCVK